MSVSAPPTGHVTDVTAVTFAPGGDILATADDDGTVLLCDVTDPAHFRHLGTPLTGHTSAVSDVAFASDGHTLATASDSTVILWDTTGLTRLLAQPLERACAITDGGLTQAGWDRYVPGLKYVDVCKNVTGPR